MKILITFCFALLLATVGFGCTGLDGEFESDSLGDAGLGVRSSALVTNASMGDPSTIYRCRVCDSQKRYWVWFTGAYLKSKYSADGLTWYDGPKVFSPSTKPNWWLEFKDGAANVNSIWAPDVIEVNEKLYLYYSVTTLGSRKSAIGLVEFVSLNPEDGWEVGEGDKGIVVESNNSVNYNAIDPSVVRGWGNSLWMAFGSYWGGIKMIRLRPVDGLRKNDNLHHLARRNPNATWWWQKRIEGATLVKDTLTGSGYYLTVSWGLNYLDSDQYQVRMGRSDNIHGPYLDKNGVDLFQGGGSVLLWKDFWPSGADRRQANGHGGFITTNWDQPGKSTHLWMNYMYRTPDNKLQMGIQRIYKKPNGWWARGGLVRETY